LRQEFRKESMEKANESSGKKTPSSRSMKEIMNLILKLNDKLKERISPRKKTKDPEAGETEVVIIIMTSQEEKTAARAKTPARKTEADSDWIQGLCREIEKGACPPK
jgi:hypothetical protein